MQIKAMLLLGLALLLGGLAAYMVNSALDQEVATPVEVAPVETETAVVAAADLASGTTLERVHLRHVEFPLGTTPRNSYRSIDELMESGPPVVVASISENEIVLPPRLSTGVRRRGLTTRIPDGKRAISIPVNDVRGVGGFVLPGDRVDVLHTTSVGRRDERPVSRTLLQDLTVLGVDQRSSEREEDPVVVRVVTLLADPDQAKSLTLAQQVGHLTLSLRNEGDNGTDGSSTVALNDLWSYEPNERPVASRRTRPQRIQVIRGLEVGEETVTDRGDGTAVASN